MRLSNATCVNVDHADEARSQRGEKNTSRVKLRSNDLAESLTVSMGFD
jgi:hypothetical protein